jgi:hypothetical protein
MGFSHAEATASNSPVILTDQLQNYSIGQFNWFDEYVAPTLNVDTLSGQMPCFSTDALKVDVDTHVPGEEPNRIGTAGMTFQPFDLVSHALTVRRGADEDKRLVQGGFNPDLIALERIGEAKLKMAISKHQALYTLISTTGNYTGATQYPAVTAAWSAAGATPVADVKSLRRAIRAVRGVKVNCGLMNDIAFSWLCNCSDVLSRLGSNRTLDATVEDIRVLFGLEELVVCDAVVDTSLPAAATPVIADIFGAIFLLFYKPRVQTTIGMNYMRCLRNMGDANGAQVFVRDRTEERLDPAGYCFDNTVDLGYYQHRFAAINDGTNHQSIAGGIITGIY